MLHAVIMAGGAGTRFWPASRAALPKQLLNLVGGRTMIQATVDRLGDFVPPERILVITSAKLVEPIGRQLPQLPPGAIFGEPCKRDTAPCVGLAAAMISRCDEDAALAVMPADHVIQSDEQFRSALAYAVELVEERPERIVTFGVRPSYPAESFGYIERGHPIHPAGQPPASPKPAVYQVRKFREKPSAEIARQFLETGDFYWNSGIFVWKAKTVLAALGAFEPQMHARLQAIAETLDTEEFPAVLDREFAAIEGKSIDYAVMERYQHALVVEAPFQWDDVGSWQSLARLREADGDGNTVVGRHLGLQTSGSIIRSDESHLVVTAGLRDCIVVHTPDATLVANKHDEESIRKVVELLKEKGWDEYL